MREAGNVADKIPFELQLMLTIASGDRAKTQFLLSKPINWELFLRLAVHHRVYPLVSSMLGQIAVPTVPEKVLDFLRIEHRQNTLRVLNMTAETIRVVNCLESQGIGIVVLKGVALASRLYGDITIRSFNDIDILIASDQVERVNGILESEGYCKVIYPDLDPRLKLTSGQLKMYAKTYSHPYHLCLRHAKKNILLEVHWNLGHVAQTLLAIPFADRTKRIQVAGGTVPVLADDECLLFLILHGTGHRWFRLSWLVDVAKLMQQDIDWEKVYQIAKDLGMQSILNHALMLANLLLAVPLPSDYQSVIFRDRRAHKLCETALNLCALFSGDRVKMTFSDNNGYCGYVYDFQVCAGWKKRLKYLLGLLRPTVDDIKLISVPESLCALYYILRPFALLVRVLGKR